ncbi:phytanoyl-CoA dioxygenase family protein [Hyphomonas sp.]|uniref:phytanoyl-CoA dioxygenase family protein n=1 Tax=Hyphomonas sp. TaxID=87 RepID=UPI003D2C7160|tara:strand:- start:14790 stop:15614 length:825 start_codon:yes stop_codon:yes gene_type:complete
MTQYPAIPTLSYGISKQNQSKSDIDRIVEQIRVVGYAVLDSGFGDDELLSISEDFEAARAIYVDAHGESRLKEIDELNTIRCPLSLGFDSFLKLAVNARLLTTIDQLIFGIYTLNQQNGIINPPGQRYNQAAWHRDLPYQHFVSSRPIAINALFCVDPFLQENGATFVLPASHKSEEFPSADFVKANAVQICAPAGSYILLDCMTYHSGGLNQTDRPRRAVNHIYNIPYFRQQISIPRQLNPETLTDSQRQILGFGQSEDGSASDYLESKRKRL